MKQLPHLLAITLPIVYVLIVVVTCVAGGEAPMWRLATDWPILVVTDNCSWCDARWADVTHAVGGGLFAPLDVLVVSAVYALIGYLAGAIVNRTIRWFKARTRSIAPFRRDSCCRIGPVARS